VARAHQFGQFLVDDLDHLLTGGEARHHLLAQGAQAHVLDEALDHAVVDIGLEQGQADFLQALVDVIFAELAVPPQLLEDGFKLVAEIFEHKRLPAFYKFLKLQWHQCYVNKKRR